MSKDYGKTLGKTTERFQSKKPNLAFGQSKLINTHETTIQILKLLNKHLTKLTL